MKLKKFGLYAVAVMAAFCGTASAAPVVVTGYDIENAVESGFGGWGHSYTGTIAPGAAINVSGFAGTLADYSGGTGTMADGITSTMHFNTQLFSTFHAPVVTVYFDQFYELDSFILESFIGAYNSVRGNMTGLTVTFGGLSVAFNTQATGPNGLHEFVDFTASAFSDVQGNYLTLSNFTTTGSTSAFFSIGEMRFEGTAVEQSDVPAPASLALLGFALAGLGALHARGRCRKGVRHAARQQG